MKRRNFLKAAPVAGIVVGSAGFATSPSTADDNFELNEETIDTLQQKMKAGSITSKKLTELYLARIAQLNKKGPKLNAVIEINPDAVAIAQKLDDERKSGKIRGPLHGIPVLIKDNIDTGDKMLTTAGSIALINHRASQDAFIVKKLREAGGVLLGKTNCSEWSNFRSSRSSSGWSSRGGQTKNACVLDRSPSGSSSGSAVAVAANMCVVSVGTETDGSIVAPSSFNGIVGIKPTVGLWSRSGIIPISKTQDTPGPMARTVRDAAIFLGALTAVDDKDDASKNAKTSADYTTFLKADGLKGARIGIEKSHLKGHEDVVALYKNATEVLKSKGATVVEVDLLKKYYDSDYSEFTVLLYEFKDGVNKYLSQTNADVKSIADVIAFNKKNEAKAMPYFKQETLESSNEKGTLKDKEYVDAIAKRPAIQKLINELMDEQQLDAICGVSIGPACGIDVVLGDYNNGYYFCPPAAVTGYPHMTVPMGKVHELPVGLSFMCKAFEEGVMLKLAYAFEQATKKRETPKFIKSTIPDA